MCKECGCGTTVQHHHHDHSHANGSPRTVEIHQHLLAKNDHQADHNRALFAKHGVRAVNLLSSPGSGKTRLLERTLTELGQRLRLGVIVGDLQTDNDARRLRDRGSPVLQITTGTVCHLEADMVAQALTQFDLAALDVLFIENVGNLVCPAAFELGEAVRAVLLSTTEGEDKPLKYPLAFKTAQVVLITKTDLAAATEFDREQALSNVRRLSPDAKVIELSARTGQNVKEWYRYLEALTAGPVSKSAATALP